MVGSTMDCRTKSDLYQRQPVHLVSTDDIPMSCIAHLIINVQLGVYTCTIDSKNSLIVCRSTICYNGHVNLIFINSV